MSGLQLAGVVEACCWLALVVALCAILRRRIGTWHAHHRLDIGLLLCALVLRLATTPGPSNDYTPHANLEIEYHSKYQNRAWVPFVNRLVGYEAGAGLPGVAACNTVMGVGSVLLLRRSVLILTGSLPVAAVAAALMAITPLYVRIDTSDAVASAIVFLWLLCVWAFTRAHSGLRWWPLQLLCFASTAAGAVLRPDALWLFAVIPVVGRPPSAWPQLWSQRKQHLGWMAGVGVGFLLNRLVFNFPALEMLSSANPIFLLPRLLFLYSPALFGFFPLALVILGWAFLAAVRRRRAWETLATYVCSVVAVSVPYLVRAPIFLESHSGSYNLAALLVPITASAAGAVYVARWVAHATRRQRVAVALLGVILAAGFVIPYRSAYPFQSEYRFLQRALPPTPAKVLVYFDDVRPKDLDCCLYFPQPLLTAERSDIQWLTISPDAVTNGVPADLDFDYYYPGAIVAAEPELAGTGAFCSAEDIEATRTYIQERRRLDAEMRSRYQLEVEHTENLRAEAFYQSVFADNRMDLVLYRNGARRSGDRKLPASNAR